MHGYLSLFYSTGSVALKQHAGGVSKALNEFTELQILIYHPTAYLREVQELITLRKLDTYKLIYGYRT